MLRQILQHDFHNSINHIPSQEKTKVLKYSSLGSIVRSINCYCFSQTDNTISFGIPKVAAFILHPLKTVSCLFLFHVTYRCLVSHQSSILLINIYHLLYCRHYAFCQRTITDKICHYSKRFFSCSRRRDKQSIKMQYYKS